MTQPTVTAIVVNWQLKEATGRCLHALEQSSHACRLVVVDNGSQDGSVAYLAQTFPAAHLIALPHNIGFGPACNYAIRRHVLDAEVSAPSTARHEYVLLLNNDAQIAPNAVAELLQIAQSHPQAGIFGAKVYSSDRPNTIWYAGAWQRRVVLTATHTGRGQLDLGQFNRLQEVDYIFGAAMLIRRTVIEQIGLFDERFFLYLEDLDFCLRAQQAGFTLLFVPQAHVWHEGSASTAQQLAMRRYHMTKSTMLFLRKHTSTYQRWPIFLFWILVHLHAIVLDIVRGDISIMKAYMTGLRTGLAERFEV